VTVVDGHARAAPASAAEPGPNLDVLDQVQQRVLCLATSIVHAAAPQPNHSLPQLSDPLTRTWPTTIPPLGRSFSTAPARRDSPTGQHSINCDG